MKNNLVISDRGQVTLPSAMRKSLGLRANVVLTAETIGGQIVLTPAMVIETETYTDAQIAEWNRADAFKKNERDRLLPRLKKRRV